MDLELAHDQHVRTAARLVSGVTPNAVTVVVPSIPPRADMLCRALASVTAQDYPAAAISLAVDYYREGAPRTRQRALDAARTPWVAFLDDDDVLDTHHLSTLLGCAIEHGADYVWSRFRIGHPGGATVDGPSPLGPGTFSQWDDEHPAQTTITTLVRTELAREVGGFAAYADEPDRLIDGQRYGEDFDFTMRCRAAGAVFRHAPVVTWTWMHHGYGQPGVPGNTSGLPERW